MDTKERLLAKLKEQLNLNVTQIVSDRFGGHDIKVYIIADNLTYTSLYTMTELSRAQSLVIKNMRISPV